VVAPDGFPDLYGFVSGTVQFIEIKANGDRMRPSQVIWISDAIAAGIGVHILAARGARLAWFRDVSCAVEVPPPAFYRR